MPKFVYLLLIVCCIGCAANKPDLTTGNDKTSTLSFLALGDSYTIGESVQANRSWPKQLELELMKNGYNISTKIIAQTGWRTDNLLTTAASDLGTEKYDLVSLLIGVNNEYQGESPVDFESKFRECLELAIKHSKKGKFGVFIVSIPDYGYTPFGKPNQVKISGRLAQYNAICESVAKEEGVVYINITPISQKGLTNPALVASDKLHPSAKQYELWVNLMSDKVAAIME